MPHNGRASEDQSEERRDGLHLLGGFVPFGGRCGLCGMATTGEVFEDVRKVRLLAWLTTPPHERVPSSQNKLADELGVSPRTIRDWKALPAFRSRWEKEAKETFDPEMVQRVVQRMFEHALDDSSPKQAKAWELFLKTVDAIKPPQVDLAAKKAAELTDAELEALLAEQAQRELASRQGVA